MEEKIYIPFTFKGRDGSLVSMTSIDEIEDFQRSDNYPFDEGDDEQAFADAWNSFIWEFIVWTAENNKKKDKEECPYDTDFIHDMINLSDFICNSDDEVTDDFDIYKGWEYITRVFKHPVTGKLYGIPIERGSWGENEYNVDEFYELRVTQKVIDCYEFMTDENS